MRRRRRRFDHSLVDLSAADSSAPARTGQEGADICAWQFGTTRQTANGKTYNMILGDQPFVVQQNWDPQYTLPRDGGATSSSTELAREGRCVISVDHAPFVRGQPTVYSPYPPSPPARPPWPAVPNAPPGVPRAPANPPPVPLRAGQGFCDPYVLSGDSQATSPNAPVCKMPLLCPGQTLSVGTIGLNAAVCDGDTYLKVVDADGFLLAENDDARPGTVCSFASVTVPSSGRLSVVAGCWDEAQCGA